LIAALKDQADGQTLFARDVCRPTLKLRQIEGSAIMESQGRQLRFGWINAILRDDTGACGNVNQVEILLDYIKY
jgi:hypothetical protein